jgi:WD40 repeat protein/DNA-binding SARP family transcriptional activator
MVSQSCPKRVPTPGTRASKGAGSDAQMARRVDFRILGPLMVRVDGAPVPIGGPKQRALLALLLLSSNRVVSRERLIGELFAEQSVNSADHALRNQVSRLRKVLSPEVGDEPRLVARAPGYLLRVEPGELDLERFERLVADGRESLAAGEAAAAADAFRAAELLWEGRPLADLEFEPFARVEVERLEELRLAAVEARIDAELALGRQLPLVGEIEALSVEHPYRERFRAQLMLALYRSGRQAEGLEVYRRTRTLLNEELGLEPGVELQELERAILTQDPTLTLAPNGAEARSRARDVCPYQGLAPFEAADAEFFFGRERLIDELVGRLADAPLLAVIGPSGSGKSSLLKAGLLPALGGFAHALLRPGDPLPPLTAGERTAVAVDQFEEVFSLPENARLGFIQGLVDAAWDPERRAIVLLAMRADFFGHVAPYVELADLIGPNHALLGPMTVGELRRAIEGPANQVGLTVESALVDGLVDDIAGEIGGLPLLSTALVDLWREREGGALTLAAYEQMGGVRGAVGRHAEAAFRSLDDSERQVARRVLLRFVAGGDDEPLTRRRVSRAELDADTDERVAGLLATLVERRLLVADEQSYELVHEALLEHWPRLAGWLAEDAQGRRVRGQVAEAAARWDAGGRDAGELYRGARLAAALDWSESAEDGLNRLERDFLEQSRAASVRSTRRLRLLLAAAVALLIAALVAGFVALEARGTARRQATSAIAQRLGAQALVEPQLDRALLLAREGVNLDNSAATRSNLLAALLRGPAALAVLHGRDDQVLDEALSGDGRLLVVRGNNGSVSFVDTRTFREVGRSFNSDPQESYCGAIVRPINAVAVSPDNRTVAVGAANGSQPTLYLLGARSRAGPSLKDGGSEGASTDVAYAPDGRTLVTGETRHCHANPPPEQLVLRRASDGSILRRSGTIPGGRLIGFTPDGRFVLATRGETASYLLDSHTFARVRTFPLSGAGAMSPVSDLAGFGQDDGSVNLVDLNSGAVRAMDRRATGKVIGVGFSRNGKVLATTSDDGSVDVWDVPTETLRETFSGHAGAAVGPVFSPDGATLYTASHDGGVFAWDVHGTRRLGRPFIAAPRPSGGAGPRPQTGGPGAVAVSPDSSLFVTSPGPNRVTLWRARDLAVLAELRGPCGGVQSLAFSHDGRLVAATGDSRTTVVWNVRTRKIENLMGPAKSGSIGVNFSYDDQIVGTAGGDGIVRLYDVRTGRRVSRLITPRKTTLQDLDFSSDGRWLAAAGLGEKVFIWNLRARSLQRAIPHGQLIFAIRFSPDGKRIATGDNKGNVDFWDAATGRQVGRELRGQNGAVISVTYSPDGSQVMTTSSDGKFRLIDVATGKLVGSPLPGADAPGWGTFFPNGKQIAATFWDGTGMVWNVDPRAWAAHACRIAHRNLTRSEWHDFLPQRPYRAVCP